MPTISLLTLLLVLVPFGCLALLVIGILAANAMHDKRQLRAWEEAARMREAGAAKEKGETKA
jgi:hypothetical protein